jgi:DNA-binding protein H-NS
MRTHTACVLAVLLSIPVIVYSSETRSAEDQYARANADSRIVIDGKSTPELVPYAIRMRLFFSRYKRGSTGYQVQLKHRLSEVDLHVLAEYADKQKNEISLRNGRRSSAYQRITENAESMSALEIASAYESTYQQFLGEEAQSYRSALAQLSSAGQVVVTQFAYEHIRPTISLENQIAIANAAPDAYKAAVLASYRESLQDPKGDAGKITPAARQRSPNENTTNSETVELDH